MIGEPGPDSVCTTVCDVVTNFERLVKGVSVSKCRKNARHTPDSIFDVFPKTLNQSGVCVGYQVVPATAGDAPWQATFDALWVPRFGVLIVLSTNFCQTNVDFCVFGTVLC